MSVLALCFVAHALANSGVLARVAQPVFGDP
jgi:hypothetical protein